MKRYALFLMITLLMLPVHGSAGEIQRIQQKGVLTVSLNRGYPPFAMERAGTVFGLDVDLAHQLAEYLGVKTGTTHEDFARQLFPAGAIKGYPTADAAADAVVKGTVDAMVADSPFVQVWHNTHVQHYQQIAALLAPVTREFYAFAIRPGDADFLNWINLFVDQIQTDGTVDLLKHEYFEQMTWAQEGVKTGEQLTRAQFLKNRFIAEKKAMIEQRRRAFQGKGGSYE